MLGFILALVRIIVFFIFSTIICLSGVIYCLLRPRNPKNTYIFGKIFGKLSMVFGIKLEVRFPKNIRLPETCIYISNHQSNFDMVTVSYAVQPRTVTIGKKSLLWIPLFGILYWLSGNFLIDRYRGVHAYNSLLKITQNIKKRNISLWIFPEGTRSRKRGILPFKTGAFYSAISFNIPIVPICVSTFVDKIKLNRWSNGTVIIEVLPPISTEKYEKSQARILAKCCQEIMINKIKKLDQELNCRVM